jgi:hypothetical protein
MAPTDTASFMPWKSTEKIGLDVIARDDPASFDQQNC